MSISITPSTMPLSSEGPLVAVSTESALLQRIEEMSFLGTLNERLSRVPDFASACRALIVVVLPAPLCPRNPKISPWPTVRSIPCRTSVSP